MTTLSSKLVGGEKEFFGQMCVVPNPPQTLTSQNFRLEHIKPSPFTLSP
jgi:hypothetical protein